jgi:hypothetical protein
MSKTLVRALRKEAVSTAKNKAWEQSKIREGQAKEEIEALGDSEIGGTDVAPKSQEDPKASTLGYGRAIYEYKAQNSEEIELREGDIVIILDKSDEGWWKGQLGHAIGFFPSNYIELISEDEVMKFIQSAEGKQPAVKARPHKSKQELVGEMKTMKAKLKDLTEKNKKLQEEIEEKKKKKLALRKDYKEESNNYFNCSYYEIDPLDMFYYDLMKVIMLLEEDMNMETSMKKRSNVVIESMISLNTSLEKLKFGDKLVPKIQAYQNALVNQRANYVDNSNTAEFHELLCKLATTVQQKIAADSKKANNNN